MKAVRVHCHAAPKIGSDTSRGRPTVKVAATSATAAIERILDLCQINFMVLTDVSRTASSSGPTWPDAQASCFGTYLPMTHL